MLGSRLPVSFHAIPFETLKCLLPLFTCVTDIPALQIGGRSVVNGMEEPGGTRKGWRGCESAVARASAVAAAWC